MDVFFFKHLLVGVHRNISRTFPLTVFMTTSGHGQITWNWNLLQKHLQGQRVSESTKSPTETENNTFGEGIKAGVDNAAARASIVTFYAWWSKQNMCKNKLEQQCFYCCAMTKGLSFCFAFTSLSLLVSISAADNWREVFQKWTQGLKLAPELLWGFEKARQKSKIGQQWKRKRIFVPYLKDLGVKSYISDDVETGFRHRNYQKASFHHQKQWRLINPSNIEDIY